MLTFDDLKEELRKVDEVTLLEILDVNSYELVDLLEGLIEDKQEHIRQYYGEDSEGLDGEEE